MYIYIYLYYVLYYSIPKLYYWVGALNGFSGCSNPALTSLFFPQHVLEIVVEVKASGPPYV